jgi:hypothetical protein
MTLYKNLGPSTRQEQQFYNHVHSKYRVKIESAFGGLKMKWRILSRLTHWTSVGAYVKTIKTHVLMHNFLIDNGVDRVVLGRPGRAVSPDVPQNEPRVERSGDSFAQGVRARLTRDLYQRTVTLNRD